MHTPYIVCVCVHTAVERLTQDVNHLYSSLNSFGLYNEWLRVLFYTSALVRIVKILKRKDCLGGINFFLEFTPHGESI